MELEPRSRGIQLEVSHVIRAEAGHVNRSGGSVQAHLVSTVEDQVVTTAELMGALRDVPA